ncbi:MAG TPA: LppP/LprE family lipoprotein [Solirubrobacteraceae bacterium]|nr:LppP/LprE family lipoprotein [Solirubrobacteraceae bacterium]
MRRGQRNTLALAPSICCAALLGACGSQTKTVTVASSPPATQTTGTTTAPSTSTAAKPSTAPARTTTAGGTAAPGTARSAPEPAFTQHAATVEGVTGAAAAVRAAGFTPNDTSEYHSGQTLRVLVGTRTGSGDGYGQRAFFFVDGRYIGTDAKEPSASVKVVSQSDTEVALAYPLYRPKDPLCCPGGGQATVRFQLNNGKLTPLGTIPPASSTKGLSRY